MRGGSRAKGRLFKQLPAPIRTTVELLLTSAHGSVAEGAAGDVLGVVGRGVLVLRVTSRRSRERRLVLVVMGGRGGSDHGDVSRPDLIPTSNTHVR